MGIKERFRRMKLIDVILALSGVLCGVLIACSLERWMTATDQGRIEVQRAKEELIASAGLFELHNAIYSKVGPYSWETEVKPRFMSSLTYATIRETGNLLPEPDDVVKWVRAHPAEARRMLEQAASFAPK